MPYDILIKNGMLIDGTGAPARPGTTGSWGEPVMTPCWAERAVTS